MSLLSQNANSQQQQRQVQRQQLSQQAVEQLQFLQLPLAALSAELRQRAEQNPFIEYEPAHLAVSTGDFIEVDLEQEDDNNYIFNRFEGFGDNRDVNALREATERHEQFIVSRAAPETLYQHLEKQVLESYAPSPQRDLILFICDALDSNGYLRQRPYELLQAWWETHQSKPILSEESDIIAAIREVQTLDPIGVGARSLSECLELQVRGDLTPSTERLIRIKLCHHLQKFIEHSHEGQTHIFKRIAKILHCTEEEVASAFVYLQTLNPYPGRAFTRENPTEEPEIRAIRTPQGDWIAQCNDEVLPVFRINETALQTSKSAVTSKTDRAWIAEHEAQARLWTEAYQVRNETLRRIAQAIFIRQHDFLESGCSPSELKPLLQKEIAETLAFDESTISRAVKEKTVFVVPYNKTLTLKAFFTRALPSATGISTEVVSDQQAKQALKVLIEAEDPATPLSDQALMEALNQQGFLLKRRTVAKYRESLGIPSTRERRCKL